MAKHLLKDVQVKNAQCQEGRKITKIADGDGLYLWCMADGSKYWRFRFYLDGKEKALGLGAYPATSLADARKGADDLRADLKAGRDPSRARKQEKEADKNAREQTFAAVAKSWHQMRAPRWVKKYAHDVWNRMEKYALPRLGKTPVKDIKPVDVAMVLEKIPQALAFKILRDITCILDYAIGKGFLEINVAIGRKAALSTPATNNHAHVRQDEFPELIRKIATYDQLGGKQVMLALQLITLTFVRANELLKAEWSEFDFEKRIWEIPASRMKMRKELLVPLAPQTMAILNELKLLNPNSRFVLPNAWSANKPMNSSALLGALRLLGYEGKQTVHGFRHLASTALNDARDGDRRMFDGDAIERQLAHVKSTGTRHVYNKAEYLAERKRMMNWWADYITGLLSQNNKDG